MVLPILADPCGPLVAERRRAPPIGKGHAESEIARTYFFEVVKNQSAPFGVPRLLRSARGASGGLDVDTSTFTPE